MWLARPDLCLLHLVSLGHARGIATPCGLRLGKNGDGWQDVSKKLTWFGISAINLQLIT